MAKVPILKREEVAELLGCSPDTVTAMVDNGSMPIGGVYKTGKTSRTIIIKRRWDLWIEGRDLDLAHKHE